ncbi:MAG: ASPIC/UnbV domain-containing protein, partial [Bryobacteraceae bacterium]|nr:ASPIC/UnbV domain-containing protein [Bryobacteraceae bacterium]
AAVTTLDGPVELWRNRIGEGRAWIGLALQGTRSNRDAIGAKVRLSAGGRVRHAHVSPYTGYLGTHTKTLYFGLAGNAKADWIEILWPSGATQRFENAAAGKVHRITEPQDAAAPGRATAPRPGGSGPSPKP